MSFESNSASSVSVTKVNLTPEQEAHYKNVYLYDKSGKRKLTKEDREAGQKQTRKANVDIPNYVEQLLWASRRLNILFGVCTWMINNGGNLQDYEDSYGRTAYLEHIARVVKNFVHPLSEEASAAERKTNDYKALLKNVFSGVGKGATIIRESEIHEGGKDIYFGTGFEDKGNITYDKSQVGQFASKPIILKASRGYERAYLENYTTPNSIALLEVLEKFRDDFMGGTDISKVHERQQRFFKLDYNFEKWRPHFVNAGLDLPQEIMGLLFKNISVPERELKNMKGFLSAVVRVDPDAEVSKTAQSPWAQYVNKRGDYAEENAPPPNNEALFTREGMITSLNFKFGLCLHVPQEIVEYITQSQDPNNQLFKLNTWASAWGAHYIRPKNARGDGDDSGVVPPFVLSPSILPELSDLRAEAGLPSVNKIGDENFIAVGPNGDLIYLPSKDEFDADQPKHYEQLQEDILRICFENNIPVPNPDSFNLHTQQIAAIGDFDLELNDKLNGVKNELRGFEGQLLGFDLDFGVLVYAGANANTLRTVRLNGTTKPEALAIADVLGYDFSGEGEGANFKTFRQSMVRMMHATVTKDMDQSDIMYGRYLNACLEPLIRTYVHMVNMNPEKFADIQAVVYQAFKELNITDLREDKLNNFDPYYKTLNEKGTLHAQLNFGDYQQFITDILEAAMNNARLVDSSHPLYKILLEEFGSYEAVRTEGVEDPRYFNEQTSTMASFGNLYHHLGGKILEIICRMLATASPKEILTPKQTVQTPYGKPIAFPDYKFVSMTVMPLAITFSKYVPQAMEYFEKAEETTESLEPDSSFTVDDMKLAGLAEGTQMFPHQVASMSALNQKPKFAVLDISPGGGKTILGIADIMNLIGQGEKIRPLVIAPDHLVPNWCDDLYKVTEGKWNTIALYSKSTKGWEPEDLEKVIESAPINTITIAGSDWLKSHHHQTNIALSNRVITLPERVDMLRKFGYNYIILDESHRAKRYDPGVNVSGRHDSIKMVTTFSDVKYVRLATGTLVPDNVKDIVGQANLFTSSIFGTPDYLEREFDLANRDDGPFLVRSKLSQHVSLITKKRKEWAFMLPNPIDTFVMCNFGAELTEDEIAEGNVAAQQLGDSLHYAVYQAVLQDTIDQMDKEVIKNPKDVGDDDDDVDLDENGKLADGAVRESSMRTSSERLQQLLTDPWGDEDFKDQAKEYGLKRNSGYVPVKIREVFKRLDNHFKTIDYDAANVGASHQGVIKWEQGMRHRELDLVTHEGQVFMARNIEGEEGSVKRSEYPTPSDIPPSQDPERWKPERTGKVLIFCRYIRTVEAIYRALPDRYKKVSRRFHSELAKTAKEDKWRSLTDFRDSDNDQVKILIANEQAITEGQNLQIASRIIRVEAPWSPGDYEQATARIFRPDVAAAKLDENGKAGDMAREVIFIDWIMCDGTMEVAKVARLISKTIQTTKFAEKGNPRYNPIANLNLPPVSMSINMLREAQRYEDLRDYFDAKATLNNIEQKEFWEMRKTTVAAMIPVTATPALPEFGKIDVAPVAQNVELKDERFKYERFRDYFGVNREAINDEYLDALKGIPVRTPFGLGVVETVRFKYAQKKLKDGTPYDSKAPQSMKILDEEVASSITVRIADNFKGNGPYKAGDLVRIDPKNCHVAAEISDEEYKTFFKSTKMKLSKAEQTRIAREEEAERAAAAQREDEEKKRQREIDKRIAAEKRKEERIRKRRQNQAQNKPINDGVDEAVRAMPENKVMGTAKTDMRVKMHIGIYNGFFGLVGELRDPDLREFDDKFGFTEFGKFIYIDCLKYSDFEAVADWLESRETKKGGNWILTDSTIQTLGVIAEVFDINNKDKFSQTLAVQPQQQLPMFLKQKLKKLSGKNADRKIRIYPIIMHDRVRLCMDVRTSPNVAQAFMRYAPIRGHKGGTGQKAGEWNVHEGMTVFFCNNKTEAKTKLRQVLNAGYKITNGKTVANNLERLKPKRAKGHKI